MENGGLRYYLYASGIREVTRRVKRKQVVYIALAVLAAVLIWRIGALVMRGGGGGSGRFSSPPVAVEVVEVTRQPISETMEMTGTIYPLYQYVVAPKVSGRIVRIDKRIGDWVDAGELVARIDDGEYQQLVLEAEANLRIARANLAETRSQFELAGQELDRVRSLREMQIAPQSDLDAAQTKHDALRSRIELAEAQVEQRQAGLNAARIRLGYTKLVAAEPGFVGERFTDEGSLLSPNSPVISVIGIDTVIVQTTVIERAYGQVRAGQSADLRVDAFPDMVFSGHVSRIAPKLQESSRVAQMEVVVANDSLYLKPGMFCTVTLALAEKASAQVVPTQAVVTRNGGSGVFLVPDGETTAHYVAVEVGIASSDLTEILAPELIGRVVTLGQHLLRDGSAVILPQEPGESGEEGSAGPQT
jgi:RND family efflux transporter MFP subunit